MQSSRVSNDDTSASVSAEAGAAASSPSITPPGGLPIPQNSKSATHAQKYWDGRFVVINAILLLLALVAGYLEYSVYPAIMSQNFGETGILLRLSPLTFRLDGTRCFQSCQSLVGIPSLDFFQIFVIALVVINVAHFYRLRRQSASR